VSALQYAKDTAVSSEQSQAEIKKTLTRYGATKYAYVEEEERAAIMFEINFVLPLPNRNDPRFWKTPERKLKRSADAAFKEWEQASRQRWRALQLAIKAKLEAVESGIALEIEMECVSCYSWLPVPAPDFKTYYELKEEFDKLMYGYFSS